MPFSRCGTRIRAGRIPLARESKASDGNLIHPTVAEAPVMVTVGAAMTVKERMIMAATGAAAAAAAIRPASQVVALERRKIQLMMIGGAVDKTKQWLLSHRNDKPATQSFGQVY